MRCERFLPDVGKVHANTCEELGKKKNGLGEDSKDTTIYNPMDHVSGFWVLFPKEHRKVEREPTTLNSVLRFRHKASFFLLFLLCFFISRARNGRQQQGVGVHFFIVRLDHRRVSSAHAGLT